MPTNIPVELKRRIAEYLYEVWIGREKPLGNRGICGDLQANVTTTINTVFFVAHYAHSWKHYSGRAYYPIPVTSSKAVTPYEQFILGKQGKCLWRGRQGYLRRDLCFHIQLQLQKELANVEPYPSNDTLYVFKRFIFTFGQDHTHRVNGITFDCDCVAAIEADTESEAREIAFDAFGSKFCTSYPEELFDEKGLIRHFPRGKIKLT